MIPRLDCRWKIAQRQITACIESRKTTNDWIDSLSSFSSFSSEGVESDLHLEIDFLDHWEEPTGREGVWIESEGCADGVSRRIVMRKPILNGILEQHGDRYQGRFEVYGAGTGPLEVLFRSCLSFLVEDFGGVMLHASAVLRNDEVWVFVGPSGAGKSTVATELADGGLPLALDRVIIERSDKGTFLVHSTPFSDVDRILSGPVCYSLDGLVFLEKANRNSLDTIPPIKALSLLVAQTLSFSTDMKRVNGKIDLLSDLIEHKLVGRMGFVRDMGFWKILSRVEGG